MEHPNLARSIFRDVIVKLAQPGARIDFGEMARSAHDAADAFEREELRRAQAERDEPPGVFRCADEAPGGYANGYCALNEAHEGPHSTSVIPGARGAIEWPRDTEVVEPLMSSEVPKSSPAESLSAPSNEGAKTGDPLPPPSTATTAAPAAAARWGTLEGPVVGFHLWISAESDEACCGHSDGSDKGILFRHDPPDDADQVCMDCIELRLPAAIRWAEQLVAAGEIVEEDEIEVPQLSASAKLDLGRGRQHIKLGFNEETFRGWHIGPRDATALQKKQKTVCGVPIYPDPEQPKVLWNGAGRALPADHVPCEMCERLLPDLLAADAEPPKPKKPRAPIACMVAGCAEKGSKSARNEAGLVITRGSWCVGHAKSLTPEDREAIVVAARPQKSGAARG